MDPSSPFRRPRDNTPFHPNDYWDRSRFTDPNPTHSLASLPSHIQSPGSGSGSDSGPGLKPWPVSRPETRPNPQSANLRVQDARGRTSDRSYAQQLKMRSRSPQFMPFERSASGSRSEVAHPRPDEKQRPEIVRAGSDVKVPTSDHGDGQPEWGQRSEAQDQLLPKQSQCQSTGKEQDEVVMSSTAYPGQEWTPAGFHGLEYF